MNQRWPAPPGLRHIDRLGDRKFGDYRIGDRITVTIELAVTEPAVTEPVVTELAVTELAVTELVEVPKRRDTEAPRYRSAEIPSLSINRKNV